MLKNKYYHLLWLMRNERRSRDELTHIQNTKLRRLIRHAYENVKFYRDIFKKIGLHPEDIKSVNDIHKIPIIDKKDFHDRSYSDLLDKRIRDKSQLIPINTSGSSGSPLKFYIDNSYDQLRKAQFLRPYISNGRGLFDKVLWFSAHKATKKKWIHRLGLMTEHKIHSSTDLDHMIGMIKRIKPTIIQGYGSVLALLGSKILEEKISIRLPRVIFTDSELLTKQMRHTIEAAFKSNVIDIYGTFETDNIAYECEKHQGYHIASDCIIMEFVNDGETVNPDEEGEIVCTVLDNLTMPFIRYNLHDIASYSKKVCSCGRNLPLMNMIAGRFDDYVIYGNNLKRTFTSLAGSFKPLAPFIHEFQVIQEAINVFNVLVVPGKRFDRKTEQNIKEIILKEFPKAKACIKLVEKINREKSGKFRAFISKVKS